MNRNPTTTGPADVVPPTRFRNQATGISPVRSISEMQGAMRTARVVECMPGAVKKALAPAQGYPVG